MGTHTWFFYIIIAPFLYAITNHIDKHLLEKYFKVGGIGALFLISSLISVVPAFIAFCFDPGVMQVNLFNIGVLAIGGCLNAILIWCYLSALQDEEATVAIVFYQLVPVIGYVLGYFILDEKITNTQLVAMGVIILGSSIISFEIDEGNKVVFKKKTVAYMLGAAFCWALSSVVFKAAAIDEGNVTRSIFWEHLVMALVGLVVLVVSRSYRKDLVNALRENSVPVLLLDGLSETLYIGGNVIASFVCVMAPISLVLLVDSFQPFFVMAIGIVLAVFFKVGSEKVQARHLIRKITAILITGFGSYLLLK